MGSGKSSVGERLSEVLSYKYIDLDGYIQQKENRTISEIFKNKGEIYFRTIESKYLKEILVAHDSAVISLGGGTPCYGHNMETIKNSKATSSVYLKTSIACLSERLLLEKDERPLISHLKNKKELNEFIGKHLFERIPYYDRSDIVVGTDNKTVDEVVESIILKLF